MPLLIGLWVVASWIVEVWDRFPHLAVTSPAKRCGKTRLLEVLKIICRRPEWGLNISPAALYRLIDQYRATILIDEAQQLTRAGNESAVVVRELLCAGIAKDTTVPRCGGPNRDQVFRLPVYSPKVVATIGELDDVLADRCLPVEIRRKTAEHHILPFRSRVVEPEGAELARKIRRWTRDNEKQLAEVYDTLDPLPLSNDRLAELLLPLQAVLTVADESRLDKLSEYAKQLDAADVDTEQPGVRLLAAVRDIFRMLKRDFIATHDLRLALDRRREEPWSRWTRGRLISEMALGNLRRPFGIESERNEGHTKRKRGYAKQKFEEAWARYLTPPPPSPKKPSKPSKPSQAKKRGPKKPAGKRTAKRGKRR